MKTDIVICIFLSQEWSSSVEQNSSLSRLPIQTMQMNTGKPQGNRCCSQMADKLEFVNLYSCGYISLKIFYSQTVFHFTQ